MAELAGPQNHKHDTEKSWEMIVSSVCSLGTGHSQQLLTVSGILERAHKTHQTDTVLLGKSCTLKMNPIQLYSTSTNKVNLGLVGRLQFGASSSSNCIIVVYMVLSVLT